MAMSSYVRQLRNAVGSRLLLLPSVTGIIFDDRNTMLLVRQSDSGVWSAPGGVIEPDEIPADAVVREVWEETGLHVQPVDLLGVFGGPHCIVEYPNGDRSAYVMVVFECAIRGGHLRTQTDETSSAAYVGADELGSFPVSPWVHHVLPGLYDRSGGRRFQAASMKLRMVLLVCTVLVFVPACRKTPSGPPDLISGTGTILPRQAECSSWFLRSDTGTLYELTRLDTEFQDIGLRVRFTLKERPDLMSICMVGPKADLVSIARL